MAVFGYYSTTCLRDLKKKKTASLHWSAGLILEMNLAPSKQATIMEGQGSNMKLLSKEVVQGLNFLAPELFF